MDFEITLVELLISRLIQRKVRYLVTQPIVENVVFRIRSLEDGFGLILFNVSRLNDCKAIGFESLTVF